MGVDWPQVLKMAALAATLALAVSRWLSVQDAALVAVAAFYLLTVRAG